MPDAKPDTRPDPKVLGVLTATLYARADQRGVDRKYADKWAEYLLLSHATCRQALELLINEVLDRAEANPPKEGDSHGQDGHGRGLPGGAEGA